MHECLLCKRDMKVSNDVFGNGCVRNIYSFLDLQMPRKVNLREETLYKNIMKINNVNSLNKDMFKDINIVNISSGASTPSILVDEIIEYLKTL